MKDVFALDVDGVVLDIIPGALDFVREKYDAHLTEDDVTDWDWDYIWSLPNGLDAEFWTRVWETPCHAYLGAKNFVQELKDLEFHIIAISTRPEMWKGIGRAARDAADRDFPQFNFDEIYCVDKHADKVEIINSVGALYMVEDNPKNAMQVALNTNARSFLMTRPWNKNCLQVVDSWERVASYEEIIKEVCERF